MSRTKVLIAVTQANLGGAQRYVYDLATRLPSDRYEIVVAAGQGGILLDKLQAAGVRTIHIPALGRGIHIRRDVSAFRALYAVLQAERPDMLHTNSSKMGGIGGFLGFVLGIRTVFTAHGWEFNAPRPFWQRASIRLFSMVTVMLSDRTIAVSESLRERMPPVLQRKITVIRNGIGKIDFLSREAARRALVPHAPLDDVWIGTVAELHPVKNLVRAIDAFAEVAAKNTRVRYVIIGEGSERDRLQKHVDAHGLSARVHLIGFVPDAAQYARAFDLVLLPSLSEGLSYAVLEAGRAGLPVIASNVGGIPEIIPSSEYGILIDPRDTGAIARALANLIADESARSRVGSSLEERVRKDFSDERMIRETEKAYATLLR